MRYSIYKAVVISVVLVTWLFIDYNAADVSASDKPIASLKVYKHKKKGTFEEMRDGDIIQGKEKYSIAFKTESPAYVYIFLRDAACRLVTLFPNSKYPGQTNPVTAKKKHSTEWLALDIVSGKATLVLLAYKRKLKDPESVCKLVINSCERGVAGTHKPKGFNRNILEVKKMLLEYR